MRALLLLLMLLNTLPLAADTKPVKVATKKQTVAYLEALHRDLSQLKTLRARFVQTRKLAVFQDTLSSEGLLCFQAPDQLRWELQKPYASALILSGNAVAKWDFDGATPHRAKLGAEEALQQALRQIVSMLKGDFSGLQAGFDLTLKPGRQTSRLVLAPKSAALGRYLKSLDFTIDEQRRRVTRLLLREPGGDSTEIRFFGDEENLVFPAGLFDLNAPLAIAKAG